MERETCPRDLHILTIITDSYMHRTRVWGAARVSPIAYRCLLDALRQCGVTYTPVLPEQPSEDLRKTRAAAFWPLFTTEFDAHQHQLTTLGDALVDHYVSHAVLRYCTRRSSVLTTNAVGELNAVFHNHFTLRLFAKELQFEAMEISREGWEGGATSSSSLNSLSYLDAERAHVRKRDVAGTSYQVALLPSGQSSLGWKFSQFVGAVHQAFGAEAASRVLERVYQLGDEPNVPLQASKLLLRVLDHFPVTNVAEAVLAAQGLSVHYTTKSRIVPGDSGQTPTPEPSAGESSSHASESGAQTSSDAGGDILTKEVSIATGFSAVREPSSDVTLASLEADRSTVSGLAGGPGLVDSVDVWRSRTRDLVARHLEPADGAAKILTPSLSGHDGWLSDQERSKYQRGPAFSEWVDFSAVPTYADVYGVSQPQDGKVIRRNKFKKQVRDPRFFDKMSDARNGLPFETNGKSMPDYLDAFSKAHRRLFEVTMLAGGGGETKRIGRVISSRYTTAREGACRAFIGGVLRDVMLLGATSPNTQSSASEQVC